MRNEGLSHFALTLIPAGKINFGAAGPWAAGAGQRLRLSSCQSQGGYSKCRNTGWGREMPAAAWLFPSPFKRGQWFVLGRNPKIQRRFIFWVQLWVRHLHSAPLRERVSGNTLLVFSVWICIREI